MDTSKPILVTGAAGNVGSVGFKIVEQLRSKNIPVRAMVRRFDDRSEALTKLGAEVIKGDLTDLQDVNKAVNGCSGIYFSMSVSPSYLEATVNVAASAKHHGIKFFLNMSQMTVSIMSITQSSPSAQQKLHWLSEQVLNWSGLPVVHIRPTFFLEIPFLYHWAAESIRQSGEIKLPFGSGRCSPIASQDVARVAVEILTNPDPHIGKAYDLTGPKSLNFNEIAAEYSLALGRPIKYVDIPLEEWANNQLKPSNLQEHVKKHFYSLALLIKDANIDRCANTVEEITGMKPMSVKQWVQDHIDDFI